MPAPRKRKEQAFIRMWTELQLCKENRTGPVDLELLGKRERMDLFVLAL